MPDIRWILIAVSAMLIYLIPAQAAVKEKDFPLPGGGSIQMIYIPAGEFLMGNNGHEPYSYPDELPQHKVYLTGYWIGKFEVTRGQYKKFIEAGGYDNQAYWSPEGWIWKSSRKEPGMWVEKSLWDSPEFTQTDDHPVVGVSYYEAEAFCKWAGFDLPTEAQWEKAARWDGKHARVFPWGDEWDAQKCNNWNDDLYKGYQSAPVGSYPSGASPYGCMDMGGNLWEWCRDWYDPDYYSKKPKGGWVDPQGPASGGRCRVMRGGSWYYFEYSNRCAYRGQFFYPSCWYYEYGMRVVLPDVPSKVKLDPAQQFTTAPFPTIVTGKSKYGADAYTGKDPIGGGIGYTKLVKKSSAKYIVSTLEELKSALASAKPGEIIYIADSASIDASNEKEAIKVPEGITIAGNRGQDGSVGPLIFTTNLNHSPLFETDGPGVRFTGLRVKGPDMQLRSTGEDLLYNATGVMVYHPKAEFDNCEFLGWSAAAVLYSDAGPRGYFHHCYIHHNRRAGNGYGVYVHNSFVLIEANYFGENRHDIAGSGRAGSSYRACYNISEANEPFTSHAFDMHGNHNSRAPGEVVPHIAGDRITIFNNTFRSNRPRIYIAIRGEPRQGVTIHNNVFENAFIGAVLLEPCSNARIYGNEFVVPAKRAYYTFGSDGSLVNGKRVKTGEMRELP